jgi:hypothetical protein
MRRERKLSVSPLELAKVLRTARAFKALENKKGRPEYPSG